MAINQQGMEELEEVRDRVEKAERQVFSLLSVEKSWHRVPGLLAAASAVDRARLACDPEAPIPAPSSREGEQGGENVEDPIITGVDGHELLPVVRALDRAVGLIAFARGDEHRELLTRALALAAFLDRAVLEIRAALSSSVSNA